MIPTANSQPFAITTGPDDALWFTEYAGNKVGRITTAGAITEFVIPSAGGPGGITKGPDDALWFTEHNGNRIGRITTAGVITEFPLATPIRVPHEITAGPDGALWFTEENNAAIGRITTAGAITEFPIPTSNSHPVGIAKGPDDALWFTEYAGNKIGRLSVPALKVLPATNIAASGTQGQTFSPTSFRYRLSATSDSLNYSISGIPAWLNANFTSGTATTAPVTVTFSLRNLSGLTPGTYAATISFTNTNLGYGSTTRTNTDGQIGGLKMAAKTGGDKITSPSPASRASFAPFFVTWLIEATGSPIAPVFCVMFGAAISLVATWDEGAPGSPPAFRN